MKKWFFIVIKGLFGQIDIDLMFHESSVLFTTEEELIEKFRKYLESDHKGQRRVKKDYANSKMLTITELITKDDEGWEKSREDIEEKILATE